MLAYKWVLENLRLNIIRTYSAQVKPHYNFKRIGKTFYFPSEKLDWESYHLMNSSNAMNLNWYGKLM